MTFTAETASGMIRGNDEHGIAAFLGVPYGQAERFEPAQPVPAWQGERDARSFAPLAAQIDLGESLFAQMSPLMRELMTTADPLGFSEDCLHLNVWTPGVDDRARPVMVWLHGGGFILGSPSYTLTTGANLAQRGDVVVVGITHRLGPFGFLHLDEKRTNLGQGDIIAALEWVRDNIAGFGGDPDNVTIFGHSGGGAKVATLLGQPEAKGLFHKAIVQSGGMLHPISAAGAATAVERFLDSLGVSPGDIERLREVSAAEILQAGQQVDPIGSTWRPVVDGRTLPADPFGDTGPEQADDIPLLVGFNITETTSIGAGPETFDLDWDTLGSALAPYLGGRDPEPIIAAAREARPDHNASDLYFEITTHLLFAREVVNMADLKATSSAPVFSYRLDWGSPIDGGKWRSGHGIESALIFDNVEFGRAALGDGDTPQRLADQMSESWIAFARTGNPGNALIPDWPAWEHGSRETMIFDEQTRVESAPHTVIEAALGDTPRFSMFGD